MHTLVKGIVVGSLLALGTVVLPAQDAAAATCGTVRFGSTGTCALQAQTLLKKYGFLEGAPRATFGQAAVNGALNYQRAHALSATGVVGTSTWAALRRTPQAGIAQGIPASCRTKGTVICVSKGQRKLYHVRNGRIQKVVEVRVAGMTRDDYGRLKIYSTINGTYRVYGKDAHAYSRRWRASMPYSIKFNPAMYVHYSPDFAARGYASASHGCVNVRSLADAKWLFRNTPVGAKVVVF